MKTFTLDMCRDTVLKLIDEYSNKGTLISAATNADYLNKMVAFINKVQIEIADIVKLPETYVIPLIAYKNLLSTGFDKKEYTTLEDITYETSDAVGGCYFEMAGAGTCLIYQNSGVSWTLIETITQTFGVYDTYQRHFDTKLPLRLVFTGDFPFTILNAAAYEYSFTADADVPEWTPTRKYTMPTNFMSLDKMKMDGFSRYDVSYFRWENDTTLVVPYNAYGVLTIYYFKHPTLFTENSAGSTTFSLDDKYSYIIPYKVAHLLVNNDQSKILVATKCLELYEAELSRVVTPKVHDPQYVQNVTDIWGD
jgi:hypothetical protein